VSGRYGAHAEYRDSGLDWLGRVPKSWELRRLGSYFQERRTKVSDADFAALSVTMQGIVPQLETAAKTDDGDNRKLVRAGDFVINSRSDRKGSSGVSPCDGSVSLISIVLKPTNLHPPFVHHLLRSTAFQEEFYRFGKGIVADLWSTNYAAMKNIVIPVMPSEEQTQIAKFLDYETTKIDALIEKQQQLIALLKEKRQAVISHVVTKGLNLDAPMRDSGVEWLGEVPAHWSAAKLKHHVRQIVDGAHFTPTYVDDGVPFLRVTDVQTFPIDKSSIKYIPEAEHKELVKRCRPEPGDLLLSKNGTIGVPRVVDWDWDFSIFVSLCLIKLKESLDVRFLFYFFLTHQIREQIFGLIKQSTVINLHLDKIENFWLAMPPLAEQKRIAEHLDRTVKKYDLQVQNAEAMNDLLHERRTALISAAVTGKIDVRDWNAPESEAGVA
jgi:type I restriction enzyme, S subunit